MNKLLLILIFFISSCATQRLIDKSKIEKDIYEATRDSIHIKDILNDLIIKDINMQDSSRFDIVLFYPKKDGQSKADTMGVAHVNKNIKTNIKEKKKTKKEVDTSIVNTHDKIDKSKIKNNVKSVKEIETFSNLVYRVAAILFAILLIIILIKYVRFK